MRIACAVLLAVSLFASNAFAGAAAPLAPGRPAGVRQADAATTVTYGVLSGFAVLGILLALQSRGAQMLTPDATVTGGPAAAITTTTTTTQ